MPKDELPNKPNKKYEEKLGFIGFFLKEGCFKINQGIFLWFISSWKFSIAFTNAFSFSIAKSSLVFNSWYSAIFFGCFAKILFKEFFCFL